MKIGIDVRVEPGWHGGVAPALGSLISALGSLTDGPEEYAIIVKPDQSVDWLRPLGANQKFVFRQSMTPKPPRLQMAWQIVRHELRNIFSHHPQWPEVNISDGYYESLGCDVLHFPTQHSFTVCAVPTVYNPHDLQHCHYPQFFTPKELAIRQTLYSTACHMSQTIIVNSQWVKSDVIQQYGVAASKVQVIPEAPPTQFKAEPSIEDLGRLKARHNLPDVFALYPSVTWPHKNHLRLFEALAYLRDQRGLVVPLVCTGSRLESSWPQIESKLTELGLTEQVRFLGFVPDEDLRGLYRLARCLVLPTLFEANSLPIFEAWFEGTPVACADVTALPEQLKDSGLLFDPFDPTAIGDAVARLVTDDALRKELQAKGRRRITDFDWTRTAKAYRAVYRRTARQRLSEEDRMLLGWDWMGDPRRH